MAKKTKAATKGKPRERRERRFEPQATTSPTIVYLVGAIGSMAMGAGAFSQWGSLVASARPEPLPIAPWILAAGALLVGLAIWIGTSGEASLRVGDAGIAVDKGSVRRMPWHSIDKIEWREEAVRIEGKDEAGVAMSVVARVANNPQAAAWIVKEARARVPKRVDVPADATLPEAAKGAQVLPLEPPQVVGKRCAASGKIIAYEPDARVCPRCERVYHKAGVPEECECGASLEDLRAAAAAAAAAS